MISKNVALIGLFSLLSFVAGPALAQNTGGATDEFSFYLGEFLPSGIQGVTEILPEFGGRYSIGLKSMGHIELGLFNTHSYGTDFTTGELSLRGSLPFTAGVEVVYYGGLDFNYYKPDYLDDRIKELGYHLGAGAMMSITDNLSLRADLKFMAGARNESFLVGWNRLPLVERKHKLKRHPKVAFA